MMESSFWGVILKPEKRYEQTVEKSFHVSKATIEPGTSSKVTSVYLEVDNHDEFILCNLSDKNLNETLDLNFMEGEKICFKTTGGGGTIHLTGYLIPESEIDNSYAFDSEAEEASSEEEEEEVEEVVPQLVNGGKSNKRKKESLETAATPSKKKKSAALIQDDEDDKKNQVKKAQNMKKKMEEMASKKVSKASSDDDDDDEEESDDDESSDDGIMDFTDNFAEENDSPESEDSDDDGESDDEEDDEDSDDDEEENDSKMPSPKVTNGKQGAKTPQQTPKEKKKNVESPAGKNKTPNKNSQTNENGDSAKKTPKTKTPVRTLKGGIKVEDLKVGSGPEAKRGKMLGMYYDGRLKSNNKRFDATLNGKPFKFRLGAGEVIKGWDLGLEGIKVGGKRRLTLPPNMAYGSQGAPPDIPPNSSLVFEVECKHVN